MKKLTYVLGLLICLVLGIFIGNYGTRGNHANAASGTYEAFSVAKAFDPYTGEAVYLVVAMPMKEEGLVREYTGGIKFYQIPRAKVANLPCDRLLDVDFHYNGKIVVVE